MSQQPIGQMNIVLSANAATFSEAISQAQRQLDKLAGSAKTAGHGTVSSMQAASGAIRELNGDFTRNTRAVERFVTMIPGVGAALKMAFPLVGGIAFASMIGEIGVKIADFKKKMEEMPRNIENSYREMHGSAQLANDDLRRSNDELRNSIAVLEHKPVNNLKIELDDTRIVADKLSNSFAEAMKRSKQLLEQNKIAGLSSLLTTHGSTSDVAGSVLSYRQDLADLSYNLSEAQHGSDPAAIAAAQKLLTDKQNSYKQWLDAKIATLTGTETIGGGYNTNGQAMPGSQVAYSLVHGPQTENLDILRGERTDMRDADDSVSVQSDNRDLQRQQKAFEEKKKLAAEGLEMQRKAAEAQMQAFEAGAAQIKMSEDKSTADEYRYWVAKLVPAQQYAGNLLKVQEKVGSLYQELGRQIDESITKAVEAQKRSAEETTRDLNDLIRMDNEYQRAQRETADAVAKLGAEQQKNVDALKNFITEHEAATGAITKYDAAVRMAQAHTEAYAAELAALQAEKDANDNDTSLSPEQKTARNLQVDIKSASLQGASQKTSMEDQLAIANQTALGAATSALQTWTAAALDSAAAIRTLIDSTLNDVNKGIIAELTGKAKPGEWKGIGGGIATNVAGAALKFGEGSLMKGLGLDKLGGGKLGTQANPMWVQMAGSLGGASIGSSSLFSGLLSKTGPGTAAESTAGSLISTLLPMIPGFAGGVENFGGGLAITSEDGPELVNLPKGSSVTPNGKWQSMMGNGETHHHWNIDARGSTDPAQTMAMVQRGIMEAAPHLISASVKAGRDDNSRRSPSSRR